MANKSKETKAGKASKSTGAKGQYNASVWLCVFFIAVTTYIVFSPSLKNEFTTWDDDSYVTGNSLVVNDTVNIKKIFETPVAINYHPLTILSLAWNYQTGKLNPEGYHLENVLLHVLNTILVFFFIFLLTRKNLLMAGIVALFFGIHPMHVESVAWVSERKDVLYVFFLVLGLITYLKYNETKKIVWYFLTLGLFVLSCLSKGMAVVFPIILLLIDYLHEVKWTEKVFTTKIPFVLISVVFGIAAIIIQKENGATGLGQHLSIIQRVEFSCYGAVMYIVKFFVPINLAMFYPYPIFTDGHVPLIIHLSPFILIAGVALIYFFLRKEKALMFGLLFYFFSIVLVIQFFPVGNAVMADRYSYLAYIGLLFVVAWLFNKVWTSQVNRYATLKYPFAIVLFVAAILFSVQSWSRTQVWRNTSTLWADELGKYPYVAPTYEKFYHSFALYYQAVKQYDRALLDWNSALILNANDTTALNNRANILYQRGEYDPALVDYTHAIGLNPKDTLAYANRALVFVKKKDYADAEKDFAVAIKLDSARENNYFNRGLFYNETNQDEKALADFKKCLQLKAGNDSIYNWLGVSNHKLKRYDEAIANFTKAITLKPQSAQYWLNRSFSENALNEKQEAGKDAIKAQQLGMAVDVNYLKFLGLQ